MSAQEGEAGKRGSGRGSQGTPAPPRTSQDPPPPAGPEGRKSQERKSQDQDQGKERKLSFQGVSGEAQPTEARGSKDRRTSNNSTGEGEEKPLEASPSKEKARSKSHHDHGARASRTKVHGEHRASHTSKTHMHERRASHAANKTHEEQEGHITPHAHERRASQAQAHHEHEHAHERRASQAHIHEQEGHITPHAHERRMSQASQVKIRPSHARAKENKDKDKEKRVSVDSKPRSSKLNVRASKQDVKRARKSKSKTGIRESHVPRASERPEAEEDEGAEDTEAPLEEMESESQIPEEEVVQTAPWWREGNHYFCDADYHIAFDKKRQLVETIRLIGVLFGSYNNLQSKLFMKHLNKFYSYVTEKRIRFEVIYCPMDELETDCEFFVKALMGDWLVVPWSNVPLRERLLKMYQVKTDQFPTMVIVKNDSKGTILTANGRDDLLDYGHFCVYEWIKLARTAGHKKRQKDAEGNAQSEDGHHHHHHHHHHGHSGQDGDADGQAEGQEVQEGEETDHQKKGSSGSGTGSGSTPKPSASADADAIEKPPSDNMDTLDDSKSERPTDQEKSSSDPSSSTN